MRRILIVRNYAHTILLYCYYNIFMSLYLYNYTYICMFVSALPDPTSNSEISANGANKQILYCIVHQHLKMFIQDTVELTCKQTNEIPERIKKLSNNRFNYKMRNILLITKDDDIEIDKIMSKLKKYKIYYAVLIL